MKGGRRFLSVFLGTAIAVLAMLYFFQEKLIFHSNEIPQGYTYRFESNFEEIFLKADDGGVLNGLHFKQPDPEGVILYCHGNAGQLDDWGNWAQELSNHYGYDVVIWDYRGYGKSTGKRRQKLMLDDGFLFYDYCKKFFREDEITLFGRSLGGFFATHVAKDHTPMRLVLESTPISLLKIAQNEYPFLPSKYLLRFRFQNDGNISKIDFPTYFIHGTADELIPFEHGEELFKLSVSKTKKFYAIEGGNHNDLSNFEEAYFGALNEILN